MRNQTRRMEPASGNQDDFNSTAVRGGKRFGIGGRDLPAAGEKCSVNVDGKKFYAHLSILACFGRCAKCAALLDWSAMSYMTHLECPPCGKKVTVESAPGLCSCGQPLLARYDLDALRKKDLLAELTSRPPGMWRYRELLPPRKESSIVSLGEGSTPLLPAHRLRKKLAVKNLYLKDESANPTGTFKARGFSAAVTMAVELGLGRLALATAGNAGGALAAYAAQRGLEVHLVMPENTPRANQLECRYYGAEVELFPGTLGDCGKRIGEQAASMGWFDMSTFREPYRVEGKKTMAFEFFEQLGGKLPDAVIYPTGGGTGMVAMWKAFEEMEALGWIGSARPRMFAVQATGCAPIVRAFAKGADKAEPWENPRTRASGLCVPRSLADTLILKAVRESRGSALAVEDEKSFEAVRELAETEGILTAPEAGAAFAGYKRLLADGQLAGYETVVIFLTGSGYKYLNEIEAALGENRNP